MLIYLCCFCFLFYWWFNYSIITFFTRNNLSNKKICKICLVKLLSIYSCYNTWFVFCHSIAIIIINTSILLLLNLELNNYYDYHYRHTTCILHWNVEYTWCACKDFCYWYCCECYYYYCCHIIISIILTLISYI